MKSYDFSSILLALYFDEYLDNENIYVLVQQFRSVSVVELVKEAFQNLLVNNDSRLCPSKLTHRTQKRNKWLKPSVKTIDSYHFIKCKPTCGRAFFWNAIFISTFSWAISGVALSILRTCFQMFLKYEHLSYEISNCWPKVWTQYSFALAVHKESEHP